MHWSRSEDDDDDSLFLDVDRLLDARSQAQSREQARNRASIGGAAIFRGSSSSPAIRKCARRVASASSAAAPGRSPIRGRRERRRSAGSRARSSRQSRTRVASPESKAATWSSRTRTSFEFAIDRFGGDYHDFEIASDPTGAACKAACEGENRCRTWTYVRPGYLGPSARCYLKDRITPPRRKPCCISGVVR